MGKSTKTTEDRSVQKKAKRTQVQEIHAEPLEGTVHDTPDEGGESREATKEKSKKKKAKREGKEVDTAEQKEQAEKTRERKRRKKDEMGKGEESEELAAGSSHILAEDNNTVDEARKEKKKRRKEKRDEIDELTTVTPAGDVDEGESIRKKKKKVKERDESAAVTSVVEDDGHSKKSKKRKDRKREEIADGSQADDSSRKKKKRRKESKSGFPDPETDDTLSEQAKKALSYAYLQAEDPASWKFNKARQNWLLRNVWSDEAIPDTHIPLTNRYLAGAQGGVRETLVKTCRDIIATKAAVDAEPVETEPEKDDTKTSVKFDVPERTDKASEAAATFAMKQKRAQGLLEVLAPS